LWIEGPAPNTERETPRERIERLIATGRIDKVSVDHALMLWRQEWQTPIPLAHGEHVFISLDDLYHAIADPRVLRRPERIERALRGLFELRTTTPPERRVGLSRWEEGPVVLCAIFILDPHGGLRAIHFVDERRIRREQRKGDLLWKQ
jgi:hypothetical protein